MIKYLSIIIQHFLFKYNNQQFIYLHIVDMTATNLSDKVVGVAERLHIILYIYTNVSVIECQH